MRVDIGTLADDLVDTIEYALGDHPDEELIEEALQQETLYQGRAIGPQGQKLWVAIVIKPHREKENSGEGDGEG